MHLIQEEDETMEENFFEGISPLEKTVKDIVNEAFPLDEEQKEESPKLNDTFPTDTENLEDQEMPKDNTFPTEDEGNVATPELFEPTSAIKTVLRSLKKNGETINVSLDLPVIEAAAPPPPEIVVAESKPKKSRSRSVSSQNPRKSQRVSLADNPKSEIHVKKEIADYHYGVLNTEINRLKIEIQKWSEYKAENDDLGETANGMIDSAIGQTELLLKKKFEKFRELILTFEEGERGLRGDDLEGYWQMVLLEVTDIDRRYDELEQWKTNKWDDPVQLATRKIAKARKPKKNNAKATSTLKSLINKMRNNQNRISPAPEDEEVELAPVRSKRLQDTPRSQPKRRSTNCAGCTPQSHRKSVKKTLVSSFSCSLSFP